MADPAPAPSPTQAVAPADLARTLLRGQDRATLATLGRPNSSYKGDPYASLVLIAIDHDASPILLISQLAEHTQNLLASPAMSLLIDGTAGLAEPLTGARVSLQGRAVRSDAARLRARFVARHPGAAAYADFGDFGFWRIEIARAHLVAGFGRIHWVEANAFMFDVSSTGALGESEADIVAHMNADHADAVQLYATKLLGRGGDGWALTGVDPEGADLKRGGEVARLSFDTIVRDAESARAELVRLVKKARSA